MTYLLRSREKAQKFSCSPCICLLDLPFSKCLLRTYNHAMCYAGHKDKWGSWCTLVEKPKIIYVTCLAHRLAQNKSSVSVSYYSNESTTEDPSAYENTPRRLCFHFPQCTVLSISLLIATGFLPARQKGQTSVQQHTIQWVTWLEWQKQSIMVIQNRLWKWGKITFSWELIFDLGFERWEVVQCESLARLQIT